MKRALFVLLLAAVGIGVWSMIRKNDKAVMVPQPVSPVITAVEPLPAPVDPAPSLLSEISTLSTQDEKGCLRRIGHLGVNLTGDEVAQAYAFLRLPHSGDAWEAVQKNNLMNVLREQVLPPPGLAALLAEMVASESLSLTVRDYALQHLVAFYPRGEDQRIIIDTIRSALGQVQTSMAGTAMLGLRRLDPVDNSITPDEVRAAARSIALNERAGELARLTAIRLCGEFGMEEVLPEVRSIVLHEKKTLLRVAAIGALGELGGRKDEALLTPFVDGNQSVLRNAAETALAGLREKNQS